MKIGKFAGIGGALLLGSASIAAIAAKSPPSNSPLVEGLAKCLRLTDDAARLRCFDSAAAALTDAAGSGKVVIVDREDVRRTRRALFGYSVPRLPFFSGDDSAEGQQDTITAKVASAHSIGYDKFQIRLDDGAVWETTEGSPEVSDPRRGDTVVVKRGPLGSYLMRIAGQRALRARRTG